MDNARTATLNKEAVHNCYHPNLLNRYVQGLVLYVAFPPFYFIDKGIKGPCILALHQPFDMARGFTVDDLHCIYLGVTLKMMHLWFDKVNRQKPYYIGNKVRYSAFFCMHV